MSQGICDVPLKCSTYQAHISAMVLKMNPDFDIILGCDWCVKNKADILFSIEHLHVSRAK